MAKIKQVKAREILDSRGEPTVEVALSCGEFCQELAKVLGFLVHVPVVLVAVEDSLLEFVGVLPDALIRL